MDTDRDGTLNEAGTGIGGVTLQLLDASGQLVAVTTTAPYGTYTFTNLLAGDYSVIQTQPAAYGSSTPNSAPASLFVGFSPTVDFGETTGKLAGVVYHDINNDGLFDGSEPVIEGARITLTGVDVNGGAVSQTDRKSVV